MIVLRDKLFSMETLDAFLIPLSVATATMLGKSSVNRKGEVNKKKLKKHLLTGLLLNSLSCAGHVPSYGPKDALKRQALLATGYGLSYASGIGFGKLENSIKKKMKEEDDSNED